jgi:threonine/homoserine/homoserine lactone efflux protein
MLKFIKGFFFAMLIQIAIGPVCIFVFNTALSSGFTSGMAAVFAVTIVDALFIAAALIGIATVFGEKHSRSIRIVGAAVLIVFSLHMIYSALLSIDNHLVTEKVQRNIWVSFMQAFLLTAANPLTIIFWAGVFGTKLSSEKYNRRDALLFSLGCVSATLIFLGCIALAGSLLQNMLDNKIIIILNIAAGIFILLYGIRMLIKKNDVQ